MTKLVRKTDGTGDCRTPKILRYGYKEKIDKKRDPERTISIETYRENEYKDLNNQ